MFGPVSLTTSSIFLQGQRSERLITSMKVEVQIGSDPVYVKEQATTAIKMPAANDKDSDNNSNSNNSRIFL